LPSANLPEVRRGDRPIVTESLKCPSARPSGSAPGERSALPGLGRAELPSLDPPLRLRARIPNLGRVDLGIGRIREPRGEPPPDELPAARLGGPSREWVDGVRSGREVPMAREFMTDIKTLRERARKHIENGAVTEGYRADRKTVIRILNESLATEIVCVLRYKRHYFMAVGIHAQAVAAEFLEHATRSRATPTRSPSVSPSWGARPTSTRKGCSRAATPSTRRGKRWRT
jgi:hypothetical protein